MDGPYHPKIWKCSICLHTIVVEPAGIGLERPRRQFIPLGSPLIKIVPGFPVKVAIQMERGHQNLSTQQDDPVGYRFWR